MRLLRFNALTEPVSRARTGVLLAGDIVGDLRAGLAACLAEEDKDAHAREIAGLRVPPDVRQILHAGVPARRAIERAAGWLGARHVKDPASKGLDGEPLFVPLAGARLHNPLKPGRLIVVEGNAAGGKPAARDRSPASFIGPVRDISKPKAVDGLAYGTGLAIVIGRSCHGIDARDAPGTVAGYMVANEVDEQPNAAGGGVAGDVAFHRCIIGPCLVDAADAPDLRSLRLVTRVNGKVVQSGTADLPLSVGELVAALSRHGLEAGDTIVTGMLSQREPSGTAAVPFLRTGDLLESEIEGLGVMRNRVADA